MRRIAVIAIFFLIFTSWALDGHAAEPVNGLVTYYSFDKSPVNNRIFDENPRRNDATVSSSTEFVAQGIRGGAFHFRGSDTEPVDIIQGDGIGTLRKGTISFWMKS